MRVVCGVRLCVLCVCRFVVCLRYVMCVFVWFSGGVYLCVWIAFVCLCFVISYWVCVCYVVLLVWIWVCVP